MDRTVNDISTLLNTMASSLLLVDKKDLTVLTKVLSDLETIAEASTLPPAFKTLAKRSAKLAEHIIMHETDFDGGLKKLGTSIGKMITAVEKIDDAGSATEENTGSDKSAGKENEEPENEEVGKELADLIIKFASSQQSVFEDFEAYILEMEKGNPQAKAAIKRILHTWKGEFGVLSLQTYSKLIHHIEDDLENDKLSADNLFKLKDFLAGKITHFASGTPPALSDYEIQRIIESNGKNQPEVFGREEATPSQANPENPPDSQQQLPSGDQALAADPSMISDFITEARDHIHSAETYLLELETNPKSTEHVDTIFRAWHTIKGVAGFLALTEINTLAHSMENMMDRVRKKEFTLDVGSIDLLLESNDCLKEFINNLEGALTSGKYAIPVAYRIVKQKLSSPIAASAGSTMPVDVTPEKKLGEILVESGKATTESIQEALKRQAEGDTRKLGEILIDINKVPPREVGSALATQAKVRQASIEETIRVPINRIDILIDAIGEAAIAQSMIHAYPSIRQIQDQTLHTKISHTNMIMRQIQEMAMSLRMVSIKSTFQKMARLARDLGKKCDRDIDLITEGEDTELDKSVVENIGDPLIHMIRNSVDHGIEPREERIKAGKPPKATVTLRAYHRAGSIFIEVSDDGKGLDRGAILEKAISKGLCKPDVHLTDEEIFQFIFLPGFSTAKKVTDVSGRGVGMDVVRRNIESLRGSVEIHSVPGKGTTFNIRLPLTLAIVDGMIVRAGEESYIIPTLAILESLKPENKQIETVMNKGRFVKVRGELITLVHLESLFTNNGQAWDTMSGTVIIVEDLVGKKIGLHVDEIVGQQQVVIKSLGSGIGDIPGVTGGAIMSDGNVNLILDVGGIVKLASGN